jgi:hypothetical protein
MQDDRLRPDCVREAAAIGAAQLDRDPVRAWTEVGRVGGV